jgi:HAD superfamily hydrolase (TIGR01458 family)
MSLRAAGCVIDLDGTMYQGGRPIPGAADAVARLRAARVPMCFATNTTRSPRSALTAKLAGMGITVTADELLTAPVAAARWLEEQGAQRVLPLVVEETLSELGGFELGAEGAEYVLVGDLGEGFTFERLNQAFRALLDGALLVAIHANRWWDPGDGPTLDAGPFVVALEYASRQRAVLVGKPNRAFFAAAVTALGLAPERVAVVGDSLENDVWGGKSAGCLGVAVRTGSFDEEHLHHGAAPDAVLRTVADLPAWLGL